MIFAAAIILFLSAVPLTASASSATALLTGPNTLRAGDTVTLSFSLNGNGIFGASGTIVYDSNQLTLSGTAQKIASPWVVEFNGNNFVAYDNNLSNPINGNKAVFTVTFKVKAVAVGTGITVSCTGVTASDGTADIAVGTVSCSATVAAPLSTSNKLSGLTVGNAKISPAFSPETLKYTAEVPFEISRLEISATAADGKAKVAVNSPNLAADATTNVTVTVTAENGAKKVYTISVKRAADPNYKPSGNSALAEIKADGFLLSPAFNTEIKEYVIWLPFETESISISALPADAKATVEVIGGTELTAGADNTVTVICTAENGEKTEYTVIAKRAAAHGEAVSDSTAASNGDKLDKADKSDDDKKGSVSLPLLIVACVLSFAAGAGGVLLLFKFKRKIPEESFFVSEE